MKRSDAIAAEIPRLRRYARALLGDTAEADDLVQDCLLRALGNEKAWRDGDSPRKWLFTILHNLHVDRLRRNARRPPHVALGASEAAAHAWPAADGPTVRDIDTALRRLPEEQRQVVLLVALEGLSYAETAEVLGAPIGTVMSRLARGRERLRAALDGDDGQRSTIKRVK